MKRFGLFSGLRRNSALRIILAALAFLLVALVSTTPTQAQGPGYGSRVYIVQYGDTLSSIAARCGVSVRALIQANNFAPPYYLGVGRPMYVPYAPPVYNAPGGYGQNYGPMYAPPSPAAAPPYNPTTGTISYQVQFGDTLFSISRRFGVSVDAIAAANNIPNPNLIYAGSVLLIPQGGGNPPPGYIIYTVQPGDDLYRLSLRFGTTIIAIQIANNIPNPNLIYAGQRLVIPVAPGAVAPSTPAAAPTIQPSPAATNTPVSAPTLTPTATMTPNPAVTETSTPTATATVTAAPSATNTPVPSLPPNTAAPAPSVTNTPSPTATPVPPTPLAPSTATPIPPTATPSLTATPLPPTATPLPLPTNTPLPSPTNTPLPLPPPPTATPLPPPTATPLPPPPTNTPLPPPTNTPLPPPTNTPLPPPTNTPLPPPPTATPLPPPPTNTPLPPPTNTPLPPPTNTPLPSATPTATPTFTPTMTATPTATPMPPALVIPVGPVVVSMNNAAYNPNSLLVRMGTTVTWRNDGTDLAPYTVTSGSSDAPTRLFDSGNLVPGQTFQVTFNALGSFPYYSRTLGSAMVGVITVVP